MFGTLRTFGVILLLLFGLQPAQGSFTRGWTDAMRTWDFGYRLRSIQSKAGSVSVSGHDYVYDALDRRTRATLADGSSWQYDYNNRNELVGGRRFWPDLTPVSGQQFEYGYDAIGNQTSSAEGGNSEGEDLRAVSYTANELNQYTELENAGISDIIGLAYATAAVTVNGYSAYQKGEYFHREINGGSPTDPTWQTVTTVATQGANSETNSGSLLLPPTTQGFSYDDDGNLINDGVWAYTWDAGNRLRSMTSLLGAGAPNSARQKLEFLYDGAGRRAGKSVSTWNGTAFANPQTNKFVYAGWNLIGELDHENELVRSYSWGMDLSQTLEGAGGIGGLAMLTEHTNSLATHFPAFDGNGNVMALVKADGSVSARYEYSPFGQLIRATGPLARDNPFRWSTKYWDEETGLSYYGYRYYSPSLARWLNRDPIEEEGGLNVYAFVANSSIHRFDPFGTTSSAEQGTVGGIASSISSGASQAISILGRVQDAVDTFNFVQQVVSLSLEMDDDVDGSMLMAGLQLAGAVLADGFVPLAERETTLYRLVDVTTGEHLKFGVTWNPDKRYSDAKLSRLNAKLDRLATGKRIDMLRIERFLHTVHPLGKLEGQKWYRIWQGVQIAVLN